MILKQEKNKKGLWWAFVGFIAVAFFSILSLDFGQYDQYKQDLTAKLMSQDPGFARGPSLGVFWRRFKNKFPRIVEANLNGFEGRPEIDRIDIDIKFDDMQRILADRERAMQKTILRGPTKVPAKLRYKGKTYKAKIRLKGDLEDHWSTSRRMSLRVSLKGKNSIFGYKAFSIHKPRSRQHPQDQTYQAIRQLTGGLSANHTYARIYVNGTRWGIMNIEEHMTKELLEKSQYKDSLIFKFGTQDGWYYKRSVGGMGRKVKRYRIGNNILNTRIYRASKYLQDDIYRQWYSYIVGQRLSPSQDGIYDIDKFARGLILARIWNNTHTLAHSNSRYYFNPYTLKLEPITTDQGRSVYIRKDEPLKGFDPLVYKMYQDVMSHKDYANNFEKNFQDVIKVLSESKPVFEHYHSYFPLDGAPNFTKILGNISMAEKNKTKYFVFPDKADFLDTEVSRKLKIDEVEVPPEKAKNLLDHIHALHYTDGRIELYNLLATDLKLVDIRVDGVSIPGLLKTLPAYGEISYKPQMTIKTSYKGLQDGQITIVTELHGYQRQFTIPFTLIAGKLFNPLVQDNAASFDFLIQNSDNSWLIKPGKWAVNRPIYIQGDLHINAGTELTFVKSAYMIVHGDLTATGTATAKIIFKAKNKLRGWKGMYIYAGDKGSRLSHMNIKNTQALEDGLLKLTGGTTFYRTKVVLNQVKFLGTQAEDALNLVHTNFSMNRVRVSHTRSDGFDGDFSNGDIHNSLFEHVGGDALDYSGSKVRIHNTRIRFVKDKAVSVGEASEITVIGGKIHNVGVAIASKDGSKATISNVYIRDFDLSAAMTYIKKPFYGASSLVISNSDIEPDGNYFRQVGTTMTVDNEEIPAQKIDVETLYQTGVMKK